MLKKILLFTFLTCMSIASSCFAVTWIKMGPVVANWHYDPAQEDYFLKTVSTEYYFNADSITVNKYNKTIEFLQAYRESDEDYNNNNGRMFVTRRRLDFSQFDFDTDQKMTIINLLKGEYYDKLHALKVTTNYLKRNEPLPKDPWQLSKLNIKSRYYRPLAFYNEFAYHLDLPNLDGSSYLTPKGLGLQWIKSTSEFGVFYDPKSVKAKGDSVSAKIYIWIPSINRIEMMSGKFNYLKKTFKPNSVKFYRISNGECTESYKQGLIPGLVGDQLHTFRFGDEESLDIAADFFKSKLAQ